MTNRKDVSKDVLNVVKNKTGKTVSQSDIFKLAGQVKPSTTQNEQQLRQLIEQVAALVNVTVSEKTMKEIIDAIQNSNVSLGSMDQIMKMLIGKK